MPFFAEMVRKVCDFFYNENFISPMIILVTNKWRFSCDSNFCCDTKTVCNVTRFTNVQFDR